MTARPTLFTVLAHATVAAVALGSGGSLRSASAEAPFPLVETTIADVRHALADRKVTCHEIVATYLRRIAAYDRQGPRLNAIRALNPAALAEADAFDKAGDRAAPLACVPLVLKDNYDTAEMPTTGGSVALAANRPRQDASVVTRLRRAGAIILAKTNMQELALGGVSVSSLGGQVLNPYDLTLTPGGSSGGTGAAVAANLALAGTGSDTVNSIRSPASANDLVGLRPTKGLVSVAGIIPVSSTQDAVGPLARSVGDVAALLQAMAGRDPADPSTAAADGKVPVSYAAFLKPDALKGARIGVVKTLFGSQPDHAAVNEVMRAAMDAMVKAGATLVTIDDPALDAKVLNDDDVQTYEFKTLFNRYLAGLAKPPQKDLSALIASGGYDKPALGKFLAGADARADGMSEPAYKERLARIAALKRHLAAVFDDNKLDALLYPLQKGLVVPVGRLDQPGRNGILAGLTGYPAIDLPAGFSPPTRTAPLGVPVGMDLLGRPWGEGRLLGLAYSFEQATHHRKPPVSAPPLASAAPQ